MPELSLDFQQAKVKHLQFKSNLRSILYGVINVDEKPVLSHYECAVGKWIYDYALAKYGHLSEMTELEKVHAEIHKKARELVHLYKEGKVPEAKNGLGDIEEIAGRLVHILEIIEQKIKGQANLNEQQYESIDNTRTELTNLINTNENLDKIIKRQSLELSHERENLKELFMHFPAMISVIKGKDQIIEMANDPVKLFINKEDIIGKSVKEVLPELESQGYLALIESVYRSGEVIKQREVPVKLTDNMGGLKTVYIDFSLIPLRNADNETEGVLSFSYDVTTLVESRKKVEESALLLKHANEDLESKVAFRNIQLERENRELLKKLQNLNAL